MNAHYSHLSVFERCLIFDWYHYRKKSLREIRRNKSYSFVPTYYPHPAQTSYEVRMRERARRVKLKSLSAQQYVTDSFS
ncbi:MAG: IS30 family transposase [Paraglaciecola sp.]|jgi:IS30 family transposase